MCEQICNKKSISVVNNAFFSIPLKAHKKKLQFEMTSETVVTRSKKLQAIADPSVTFNKTLPDLHPVDCTVGLMPDNFCKMQNIYRKHIY